MNVPMNGFTRSTVRCPLPSGWFEKHSVTLLAPDGQANIIASREPLDPSIDTSRYASVQGELLRKEFPGFREHAFTVVPLNVGPAYLRLFSWTPPDGVPVVQQQIYLARAGEGYTATATTPQHSAERFAAVFDEVLRRIQVETAPTPPLPSTAPPEPPACAVILSRPSGGMPPPLPREVPAAVDRLIIAATDALAGTPGLLGPAGAAQPVDAWDLAVLRQTCDRLLGLDGAVERVLLWADAAAAQSRGSATAPPGPASDLVGSAVDTGSMTPAWEGARAAGSAGAADLLWATSSLLVALGDAAGSDGAGLARGLDRVTRHLPEPDTGWWDDGWPVLRHPRYTLHTRLEPGSGRLLWPSDDRAGARWGSSVDHFDLPVPLALAQRIDDLVRRYDASDTDGGGSTEPAVRDAWHAFLDGYADVVTELREALDPTYVVDDRIAP